MFLNYEIKIFNFSLSAVLILVQCKENAQDISSPQSFNHNLIADQSLPCELTIDEQLV